MQSLAIDFHLHKNQWCLRCQKAYINMLVTIYLWAVNNLWFARNFPNDVSTAQF